MLRSYAGGLPAWVRILILLLGGILLLSVFYLGVVLNEPYDADIGTTMLMAKTMLEGNVLLKGWILGTVSAFTTELPLYAAGIVAFGLTWRTIYLIVALQWAVIVVLVVWLAAGKEGEDHRALRLLIPFCLTAYFAALVVNAGSLNASLGHLTSFAYCLTGLLLIRNIEDRSRWWQYLGFGALLALAMIGDAFAFYLMAIPVALVCIARLAAGGPRRPIATLLGTLLGSIAFSRAVLALLAYLGGATWLGPSAVLVSPGDLPGKVYSVAGALLNLFGVDWPGRPFAPLAWTIDLLHLSGLLLFGVIIVSVAIRVVRRSLLTQILVAIIVVNILENLLSTRPAVLRYLAPSLIFGIVLVGRELGKSATFRQRPRWVVLYFAVLGLSLLPRLSYAKPDSPADGLARMLVGLQLTNGYAPYSRASNTTLATAGRVTVRPVYLVNGDHIAPYPCWSDPGWYRANADFLVINTDDTSGLQPTRAQAAQAFGPPSGVYSLGGYGDLLVWNHDITPLLGTPGPDCAYRP